MVRYYLQNLINDSSGFTAIEYALIAGINGRDCLSRHQPQQAIASAT
jgi:hypothetical protein